MRTQCKQTYHCLRLHADSMKKFLTTRTNEAFSVTFDMSNPLSPQQRAIEIHENQGPVTEIKIFFFTSGPMPRSLTFLSFFEPVCSDETPLNRNIFCKDAICLRVELSARL